jgi:hypothetical protein
MPDIDSCTSAEHWDAFASFEMHTPAAQNCVAVQFASVVQPPPQMAPEQAFEPQDWYMIVGHRPSPLHDVARMAAPSVQLAGRHDWALSG